jgi:hypothetical protein
MSRRLIAAAAACLWAAPLAAQQPATDADFIALGRKYTEWFYAGQGDSLFAHLLPGGKIASPAEIVAGRDQMTARVGSEVKVLEEKLNRRKGRRQYWREARFDNLEEPMVVRFLFDDAGAIAGVGLGPKSETPTPDPL